MAFLGGRAVSCEHVMRCASVAAVLAGMLGLTLFNALNQGAASNVAAAVQLQNRFHHVALAAAAFALASFWHRTSGRVGRPCDLGWFRVGSDG
jgi:hypothetical protein